MSDLDPTSPGIAKNLEAILDPTRRTLETVHREVESLEDKFDASMRSRDLLFEDKFKSIQIQLELMESHRMELKLMAEKSRIEQKEDSKVSVDAALTAQKEAVKEATIATNLANAKSESAMTKALDQVSQTFSTAIANALTQIGNVKETVTGIDQFRRGGVDNHTEKRLNSGLLVAVISVGGAMIFSTIMVGLSLYFGLQK